MWVEFKKDYSVVNSTYYSCRGSGFGSQHLHGGSQLSVIPIPRVLMPFSGYIPKHKHSYT